MSTQSPTTEPKHILIIGAGISGLALAQALRRYDISCTIFEREESASVRKQGWALTIQWSLGAMETHFLPEIFDRVCEAQVNLEAGRDVENTVAVVNGLTGKVEQRRPPSRRFRFRRDGIREGLFEGVDVQWNKQLTSIEQVQNGIRAEFSDGSTAAGDILVGADGAMSTVRKILAPTTYPTYHFPIDAVATTLTITEEQYNFFRDNIDPVYFIGVHPETNTSLFWSLLHAPKAKDQLYKVQVFFSSLRTDQDEEMSKQPLPEIFKQKGTPFFAPLGEIVASIPEDTEVFMLNIVDWPLVEWDNWKGRCTMVGDAAHCMTPYRGEGVNHAIVDTCQLADTLKMAVDGHITMQDAVKQYEEKMRPRAAEAVKSNRQAGFDAHCYEQVHGGGGHHLLERGRA